MDIATDHVIARILLTLNVLGFSVAPAIADFSKTHATNPLWTPHARFHVVWQVLSYCGIGLLALGLIWIGGPTAMLRLWLAWGLALAIYVGFFATVFSMPMYGGKVADVNGIPPITTLQIGGRAVGLDVNVTVFCVQIAILLLAALAMS